MLPPRPWGFQLVPTPILTLPGGEGPCGLETVKQDWPAGQVPFLLADLPPVLTSLRPHSQRRTGRRFQPWSRLHLWAELVADQAMGQPGSVLRNYWAPVEVKARKWGSQVGSNHRPTPGFQSKVGAGLISCQLRALSPPPPPAGQGPDVHFDVNNHRSTHSPQPPTFLPLILILQAPEVGGGAVMGFGIGEGKRRDG